MTVLGLPVEVALVYAAMGVCGLVCWAFSVWLVAPRPTRPRKR